MDRHQHSHDTQDEDTVAWFDNGLPEAWPAPIEQQQAQPLDEDGIDETIFASLVSPYV
jgi:hypothetical protein